MLLQIFVFQFVFGFLKFIYHTGTYLLMNRLCFYCRMDNIATELESLERVFNDASAEPIRLSYGFLRSVTNNFSEEIGRGGFGVVYMVCGVLDCISNTIFTLIFAPVDQMVNPC